MVAYHQGGGNQGGVTNMQQTYDRAAEDLGNSVHLEHVNVQIPDQRIGSRCRHGGGGGHGALQGLLLQFLHVQLTLGLFYCMSNY